MKKVVSLFILILPYSISFTQPGCTDPQAINFQPSATQNDGSCQYPTTNYQLSQIAELPDELMESSGLSYCNEQLWTLNDADNPAEIFSVDTTDGTIIRKVAINGAANTDWEEMAEDSDYLYIGDFGNNTGNRTDLRIYKVAKSDLLAGNAANAALIEFSFSDQTDFTENVNNHNYDCEAMIVFQDSLHLFSKNWVDLKTRHYVLPNTAGIYVAQLRDSLDTEGLITAATINEQGTILLLGYNGLSNFMWLLFDYQTGRFFSGNKRRIELGNVGNNGQTEGITFTANGAGYISSERISVFGLILPPKLLAFQTRQWTETLVGTNEAKISPALDCKIFPNPASSYFEIQFSEPLIQNMRYELYNELGQDMYHGSIPSGSKAHTISLTDKMKGSAILRLSNEGGVIIKQLQFR